MHIIVWLLVLHVYVMKLSFFHYTVKYNRLLMLCSVIFYAVTQYKVNGYTCQQSTVNVCVHVYIYVELLTY